MNNAKRAILPFLRVLLLFASLMLSAAFAETAIRAVAPQPASWQEFYRRHPELPFWAPQPDVETIIDTGETRWTVYTDTNGFRTAQDLAVDPGRPLALALGDSFTFGVSVDYEQTFVALLEAALGRQYRFLNAGVPGYDLEILERPA